MGDLFSYLEEKCDYNDILGNIHTLVHADDTKFVHKCKEAAKYIHMNKLKLNVGSQHSQLLMQKTL